MHLITPPSDAENPKSSAKIPSDQPIKAQSDGRVYSHPASTKALPISETPTPAAFFTRFFEWGKSKISQASDIATTLVPLPAPSSYGYDTPAAPIHSSSSASSSSSPMTFDAIMSRIDWGPKGAEKNPDLIDLSDALEAVLGCPFSFEHFDERDNPPYFVFEDGIDYAKTFAIEWDEQNRKKIELNRKLRDEKARDGQPLPPQLTPSSPGVPRSSSVPIKSYTYGHNIGLIKQIRYDVENKEIYWVDPIHGKRLGEEGFLKPYFCPLDGYIYDLDSLLEHVQITVIQQLSDKGNFNGIIRSPANDKIIFGPTTLYPHRNLFKLIYDGNEPTESPVTLEIPIFLSE